MTGESDGPGGADGGGSNGGGGGPGNSNGGGSDGGGGPVGPGGPGGPSPLRGAGPLGGPRRVVGGRDWDRVRGPGPGGRDGRARPGAPERSGRPGAAGRFGVRRPGRVEGPAAGGGRPGSGGRDSERLGSGRFGRAEGTDGPPAGGSGRFGRAERRAAGAERPPAGGALSPTVKALMLAVAVPGAAQLVSPAADRLLVDLLAARLQSGGAWQPWRAYTLLTHVLVHGGPLHLALNCLWIALVGQTLAGALAPRALVALFLAGAVSGAALQLAIEPASVLVGASGGLFGLLGAFGRLQILVRTPPERRRSETLRFLVVMSLATVLFALPGASPGAEGARVSWAAHLGGLGAGALLLGPALRLSRPRLRAL